MKIQYQADYLSGVVQVPPGTLSGLVQKLACLAILTQRFTGCVIRGVAGCTHELHREGNFMQLFNGAVQNCWNFRTECVCHSPIPQYDWLHCDPFVHRDPRNSRVPLSDWSWVSLFLSHHRVYEGPKSMYMEEETPLDFTQRFLLADWIAVSTKIFTWLAHWLAVSAPTPHIRMKSCTACNVSLLCRFCDKKKPLSSKSNCRG